MAQYSYAQLERLWINAGGSKSLAPLMAAIAMAESSGNSDAYNASGATGLWQILGAVNPADQSKLTNPQVNAHEAVLKYKSQGLGAWETYTNGAYKQFYKGKVPPSANVGSSSGSSSGSGKGGSVVSATTGALSNAGSLLHGTAVVLDRFFALFAPGQGWRIVFGAAAALASVGAFKAYTADRGDVEGEGGMLPLAIALVGVAALAAFMAMRPWPQAGGRAIKPGAYLIDVVKGEPPPAGPEAFSQSEVQLTEIGLGSLLAIWAAGKAAGGLAAVGNAAGGLAALFGKLFKAGETAASDAAAAG